MVFLLFRFSQRSCTWLGNSAHSVAAGANFCKGQNFASKKKYSENFRKKTIFLFFLGTPFQVHVPVQVTPVYSILVGAQSLSDPSFEQFYPGGSLPRTSRETSVLPGTAVFAAHTASGRRPAAFPQTSCENQQDLCFARYGRFCCMHIRPVVGDLQNGCYVQSDATTKIKKDKNLNFSRWAKKSKKRSETRGFPVFSEKIVWLFFLFFWFTLKNSGFCLFLFWW